MEKSLVNGVILPPNINKEGELDVSRLPFEAHIYDFLVTVCDVGLAEIKYFVFNVVSRQIVMNILCLKLDISDILKLTY